MGTASRGMETGSGMADIYSATSDEMPIGVWVGQHENHGQASKVEVLDGGFREAASECAAPKGNLRPALCQGDEARSPCAHQAGWVAPYQHVGTFSVIS